MSSQQMPKPPTLTIRQPDLDGLTVTWHGGPHHSPYSSIVVEWLGKCEDCADPAWHRQGTPAVCQPCASLRAYAALPWWRRWANRKPRP